MSDLAIKSRCIDEFLLDRIYGINRIFKLNSEVLTTIEYLGGCEKEQPKVDPKGRRVGTNKLKDTESRE